MFKLLSALFLFGSILLWYFIASDICNMNKAENRNFNVYYEIDNSENPFTTVNSDKCDSDIIFLGILPQLIFKSDHSAASFSIQAKPGTGKTLVRCHYYKYLNSSEYFKILILNAQINEYLERFVARMSPNGVACITSNCLVGWSANEFGQLLLSVLVTQLVDGYTENPFDISNISLDEKLIQ
ncbi:unnamed protein product [Rotaria socialis]|uniref:Uncharacterized protein n=1 Tax=Rotaria socialis TaxID=392032 RepID=A0A820T7W1_9BILA|nr:unnamed protein product [Rotaria socialis]CAF3425678.1 unnamed protein product [Rotaria socialis]CAF3567905.1 unnamed protein product [Rotaria socialis]CAF3623964.1 unnamed protein product [Rotaria socialis]CAF4176791.1 unnamed protein product [Rotaria socialis]